MQARGDQPGSRGRQGRAWARPWVLALGVSAAAHVLVLVALLVVRLPALQLPVTPPPPGSPRQTLFKVGVMAHAGGPAATGAEGVAASTPRNARDVAAAAGAIPEPRSDGVPPSGAAVEGAPATVTEASAGSVDATAAGGPETTTDVRADAVAGGAVTGGVALGGEATGGAVTGGAVTGGAVTGGAVTGGAVTGGAVTGGGATGGAGASGSADVVGLVHARLAAGAERCYPAAARRFQQRGTVEVRFCVDGQGAVQGAQVQRSSGAELLDGAVSACVLPQAAPFPEAARGQCFTVPVRFGLR